MNGKITALNFSFNPGHFQSIPRKIHGRIEKTFGRPTGLSFMEQPKNTVTIMHSKKLLDTCYSAEWIPYCKKTFHGAQSVIDYLGKYTHRIAISNHRIIHMDDETVTFSVKDYRNNGQWKELTLSGIEFIRRFLMHVPPKRFVRIRQLRTSMFPQQK